MATIAIPDLSIAGLDLFSDSESYVDELSDNDITVIKGGTGFVPIFISGAVSFAAGVTYSYYRMGGK
jgi:hypothetical protein